MLDQIHMFMLNQIQMVSTPDGSPVEWIGIKVVEPWVGVKRKRITREWKMGTKGRKAMLTDKEVLKIRELHKYGVSTKDLAGRFSVCRPLIWDVINFKGSYTK